MNKELENIKFSDMVIDFTRGSEDVEKDNGANVLKNGSGKEVVDISDLDIVDVKVSSGTSILFNNNVSLTDAFLNARIEYEKLVEVLSEIDKFFKGSSIYSCNYCLKIRKLTVLARERLKVLRKKLLIYDKELRKDNKGKRGRKKIRK